MIEAVKAKLTLVILIVDMGLISFYLSLKLEQNREKQIIKLFQATYIDKVLDKFHFNKAHTINMPIKEITIFVQKTEEKASPSERKHYQDMTGSIIFSMVKTRPDIAFATSVARRFVKNPSHQHTKAIKTILQYLKGLRNREITYKGQSKLKVEGYSNFN